MFSIFFVCGCVCGYTNLGILPNFITNVPANTILTKDSPVGLFSYEEQLKCDYIRRNFDPFCDNPKKYSNGIPYGNCGKMARKEGTQSAILLILLKITEFHMPWMITSVLLQIMSSKVLNLQDLVLSMSCLVNFRQFWFPSNYISKCCWCYCSA